jgi:hypothetical protein
VADKSNSEQIFNNQVCHVEEFGIYLRAMTKIYYGIERYDRDGKAN